MQQWTILEYAQILQPESLQLNEHHRICRRCKKRNDKWHTVYAVRQVFFVSYHLSYFVLKSTLLTVAPSYIPQRPNESVHTVVLGTTWRLIINVHYVTYSWKFKQILFKIRMPKAILYFHHLISFPSSPSSSFQPSPFHNCLLPPLLCTLLNFEITWIGCCCLFFI